MACLFAARLAAVGLPFTMFGSWQAGLQALNQQGVTLVKENGEQRSYPVRVTSDPSRLHGAELVLVLVKSWQTERTARQLVQFLSPEGVALTLQNGAGNRETLAQVLGAHRVALGVATAGAHLLAPGVVRPAGEGVISLGVHARLEPLTEMLRAAGFVVESDPDPDILLWGKLVINAAINPLTALLRVPNGVLLERPTARALMSTLAREASSVAVAQGIRLPFPNPLQTVETIARRTASNRSSMLQDVERGAPTEIDAICGAIVKAGDQVGVAAPINRTLWQLVSALSPKEVR
jgi:2-dehydropantoate 2-reductase